MRLHSSGSRLRLSRSAAPEPGPRQLLIKVAACGVCRTDLHLVDGELEGVHHPITPGHEVIGHVVAVGPDAGGRLAPGMRVGVPWLGATCGSCCYCRTGQENLCDRARFTGLNLDGGYADYLMADERFCFAIPEGYSDAAAAPLMCAGLIGYRSLRMAGDASRLGLYGFGAAAHILAQVAEFQGRQVFAFTRPGDLAAQQFARDLGAVWAGSSEEMPPELLDAAILFAPVGSLVPRALAATRKGGTVVCAGIHMSDIPTFPYRLLWGERMLRSVANLTRRDGEEFLELAARLPIRTEIHEFALEEANEALDQLRRGDFTGAAVLVNSRRPGRA